jgi:Ner family transcriptional regulator
MIDEKRHQRIRAALALRGFTLSAIARDLDVKPTTMTIVSKGYRRSKRIEKAIADALASTPAQIWPERYQNSDKEAIMHQA